MALRKRTVEFPIGFGVDQGKYEIPLEGPNVASLRNGRITKTGGVEPRVGYALSASSSGNLKRVFGYRNVPHAVCYTSSTTENAPCRLFALNNSRLDVQGGAGMANAVSEATVFDRVTISRDALSEYNATDGGVDWQGSSEQANPDFAVDAATNLIVIAWQQRKESNSAAVGSVAVYAEIRDATTMAVVTSARCVSTATYGANPRCINHNGSFYVVYDTTTGGAIRAVAYNQTTRAWGSDTVIVSDLDPTGTAGLPSAVHEQFWDACEMAGSEDTAWFIAYRTDVTDLDVLRLTGVTVGTTITIAEVPQCVGINADTTSLWVTWSVTASTLLRYAVRTSSGLVETLAPTTIENYGARVDLRSICVVKISTTVACVVWTHASSATVRARSAYAQVNTSGTIGTISHKNAVALVSKPLVLDGIVYVNVLYDGGGSYVVLPSDPISYESSGFATVYTVALNDTTSLSAGAAWKSWRVVAPWMIGVAGARRGLCTLSNFGKVRNDPTYSTRLGVYGFAATQEVTPLGSEIGANGIDFCRMQFDATDRFKAVEFGPNLVIAGGVTSVFDGARISEYGFWWPPENGKATVNNGAGNLSAGNYSHAACYEYKLATGDVVRSAPALLKDSLGLDTSYASLASDYFDLTLQHCTLTQRFDAVSASATDMHASALIAGYRTEANGEIYYRDPTAVSGTTYTLANDPFATGGSTVTSLAADLTILNYPALYTTGGAIPNYPLPATDDLVVHKNRLWWISSEDKRELGFTHQKEAGELPGTHPFLTLRLDDGGDCIGLAVLDEKLVVFKQDSVYVVHGDGPDRKGVGSTFQVVRVHTEHGCRDRRSIVNIPQGVMFASRVGVCLLGRGFQVEYVGGPVEDDESGLEYVAASALSDREQVYFQCREHDLTAGVTLVYHWDSGQWAIDDVRFAVIDPDPVYSAQVPVTAAYVGGAYYYAGTVVPASLWNHSGYSDCATAYIPLTLTTPWLKVSGMQGFGRLWWASLLGDHNGAHGLSITVRKDYSASVNQTVTRSEAEVTAHSTLYQTRVHIADQVGEAYKLSFTTTIPTGSHNAQCVWNGIALEIGTKGGIRRAPDARMEG